MKEEPPNREKFLEDLAFLIGCEQVEGEFENMDGKIVFTLKAL